MMKVVGAALQRALKFLLESDSIKLEVVGHIESGGAAAGETRQELATINVKEARRIIGQMRRPELVITIDDKETRVKI